MAGLPEIAAVEDGVEDGGWERSGWVGNCEEICALGFVDFIRSEVFVKHCLTVLLVLLFGPLTLEEVDFMALRGRRGGSMGVEIVYVVLGVRSQ